MDISPGCEFKLSIQFVVLKDVLNFQDISIFNNVSDSSIPSSRENLLLRDLMVFILLTKPQCLFENNGFKTKTQRLKVKNDKNIIL